MRNQGFFWFGRNFLLQLFRPFLLLEADEHKVITDDNRALDQHAVRSQQGKLLLFAHIRQLFGQLHGTVQLAAGVEKAL